MPKNSLYSDKIFFSIAIFYFYEHKNFGSRSKETFYVARGKTLRQGKKAFLKKNEKTYLLASKLIFVEVDHNSNQRLIFFFTNFWAVDAVWESSRLYWLQCRNVGWVLDGERKVWFVRHNKRVVAIRVGESGGPMAEPFSKQDKNAMAYRFALACVVGLSLVSSCTTLTWNKKIKILTKRSRAPATNKSRFGS